MQRFIIAMTALSLIGGASEASATTIYTVDVFGGFAGGAGVNNSPTPVTVTGDIPVNGFGGSDSGTAASSQGHLGTALSLSDSTGVNSTAIFSTDVIFTPTASSTLTTIPVALNLGISGSMTHSGFSYHMGWTVLGQIGPAFNFSIGSVIEGDTVEGDISSHSASGISLSSGSETLGGGSDTVSGTLTTNPVMVDVGVPVTIALELTLGGFGGGSATGDFLHSLDFPLTGIFTLPDGFTVNDPDMFIVNNNFVTPVAGVPEPSTWVLLLLGFAALGYMGVRQSRVRAIVA